MIKLNVLTLLKERGKTVYWLYKETGKTMTYQNFKRMVEGETCSIQYEYMERLCVALNCEPKDLFIRREELLKNG